MASGTATIRVSVSSSVTGCATGTEDVADVDSSTTKSVTISSLTSGCPYAFSFDPFCNDGENSYSGTILENSGVCTKPSVVSDVTFGTASSTGALSITAVTPTSGQYVDMEVQATCAANSQSSAAAVHSSLPVSITGLTAGCFYSVSVKLRCYVTENPTESDLVQGTAASFTNCTSRQSFFQNIQTLVMQINFQPLRSRFWAPFRTLTSPLSL